MLACTSFGLHYGARSAIMALMPSIQIKDIPAETHTVLRRRAVAANQSLQAYLRSRLIEEASSPTLEEVLDRASERSGGKLSLRAAVDAVREDRDRR